MSGAYHYKPRFKDIRVRPPKDDEEEDVHVLKEGERRCDHPGCLSAATAKAPKSRDLIGDFYWFCQPHAAEYNKSWDFFSGMSEAEVRRRREEESMTGGRPTWKMQAGRFSREAAAFASGAGRAFSDPLGLFRQQQRRAEAEAEAGRRLGRLERNALADLDLPDSATAEQIRLRYRELVKRCHPDANGGDRSAEHKLQRVLKAYKQLQKAKMV
jgi:hypothetical protein